MAKCRRCISCSGSITCTSPLVMKLGYGERQVLYAFIRYEMEEREKNKQATK